jgi:hypothetical protein
MEFSPGGVLKVTLILPVVRAEEAQCVPDYFIAESDICIQSRYHATIINNGLSVKGFNSQIDRKATELPSLVLRSCD